MHERALRVVLNDFVSPYSELLNNAGCNTLYEKRCKKLMEYVFKSIYNLCPLLPLDFFKVKPAAYNLRKKILLEQPKFNTVRYGQNSLKYQGSKIWNATPNTVTCLDDYTAFKLSLNKTDFKYELL